VSRRFPIALAAALAVGAVACGGPVEETLVDELRVVAAIPDQAELGAGEAFTLTNTIVHPTDTAVDTLVWMCTPTGPPGSPCLESTAGDGGWFATERAAGRTSSVEMTVSPLLSVGLTEEPAFVPTWILACEPGLCPIIDEAAAATTADQVASVAEQLADPVTLLQGLPLVGAAATQRGVAVSSRAQPDRNQHPVIAEGPAAPLIGDAEVGATFELSVDDRGELTAFSYATAGGFSEASTPADDRGVSLTWFAPEEGEGAVDLFVVVRDGEGGEALWTGTAEIQR